MQCSCWTDDYMQEFHSELLDLAIKPMHPRTAWKDRRLRSSPLHPAVFEYLQTSDQFTLDSILVTIMETVLTLTPLQKKWHSKET